MGEPEPTLADVANALADVMKRLDAMQTDVSAMQTDVSAIKKGQEHLTDLVQDMTTGHARRFDAIERDVAEIKRRLPPPASETDPLRVV